MSRDMLPFMAGVHPECSPSLAAELSCGGAGRSRGILTAEYSHLCQWITRIYNRQRLCMSNVWD